MGGDRKENLKRTNQGGWVDSWLLEQNSEKRKSYCGTAQAVTRAEATLRTVYPFYSWHWSRSGPGQDPPCRSTVRSKL